MKQRVGIAGFRGYSGAELVRLLRGHPHAEPVLLEHRHDAEAGPRPRGAKGAPQVACTPEAVRDNGISVVMLATSHEVSEELAPAFLDSGARVIDLSGAYRLRTVEQHQRWYKEQHPQPDLLRDAVYGLPEFYREKVPSARLIANPGCYPTAANIALRPLVEASVIDRTAGVVCDAKSGVSGAGRKATLKNHYCEVTENFSAYALLDHRHVPEVLQNSGLDEAELSFSAQLLPLDRGILETIYFRTARPISGEEVIALYEQRYGREPFVRLYDAGQVPDLRAVQRTNFCDLGVKIDIKTNRGVIVAAIDNLVKGAAGQAVQNLNLLLGCPETEGLL